MPARRIRKQRQDDQGEAENSGVWEPREFVDDLTETELDHWMTSSSFGSELKLAERALARLAEEQERLRLLARCRPAVPTESGRVRVEPPAVEQNAVARPEPRRRKRAVRG